MEFAPFDEAEHDQWHASRMERLEQLRETHRQQWEYLRSDEYKAEVRKRILGFTHEDTTPPWEEDEEDNE
jgi:type VI protein secretion system component VasK